MSSYFYTKTTTAFDSEKDTRFLHNNCQLFSSQILQRCVVVQEVYQEGLISSDGRLQPGDQVIEINGVDMTCAPHAQVKPFEASVQYRLIFKHIYPIFELTFFSDDMLLKCVFKARSF